MSDRITPEALTEIRAVAEVVCNELAVALASSALHQQRAILWREIYLHQIFKGIATSEAAVYADAACIAFDCQFKS